MTCCQFFSSLTALPWSTFWTSIGSLATLAAALATFYTVKEMKKAREQALEPYLIILRPNELYKFRWVPAETLQPIIRPELPENKPDQYGTRLPVFRLKNIGNGPAKNIEITWAITESDAESIVAMSTVLRRYDAKVKDKCLNLTRQDKGVTNGCTLNFADQTTSTIDYCISSPNSDFIEPIKMPHEIEASYELRVIASERPIDFGPMSSPAIDISIKYESSDGKKYEKFFTITPSFTYLPDLMGSSENPIQREFFSSDNIRGTISFFVSEAKGMRD